MDQLLTPPRTRIAIFGALLAVSSAAGCNQSSKAASPKACQEFGDRICKEVGDKSPTCTSLRTNLELFTPEACAVASSNIQYSIKALGEQRKKCDELTTRLCNEIGPKTETCDMVKNTTKSFTPERCGQMLEHYTEVAADLKRQEAKNKPLAPDVMAKLTQGAPPAFGPADSKVKLVEFSDFECPFCSRAATAVHDVKQKYGDKVHFVFRQFPLSFHPHAKLSAEASLAAHAQGKFWEFHDKVFANQKQLDRPALEGYAKELGLNVDDFKKALDEKKYQATVDAEQKLGEEVAVDGTPTIFLNGKRVRNPTDATELSKEIDEALKATGS